MPASFVEKPMKMVPTMPILPPPFPSKFMPKPTPPQMPLESLTGPNGANPVKLASMDFKNLVKKEIMSMKTKMRAGSLSGGA